MKKQGDKVLTEKVFVDTIKELRDHFASKEDVRVIVSNELAGYATKEDVSVIIRGELKDYATKEDLKKEFKNFAKTELGVTETLLDAIEGSDKDSGLKFSNHEKRITALEHAKN